MSATWCMCPAIHMKIRSSNDTSQYWSESQACRLSAKSVNTVIHYIYIVQWILAYQGLEYLAAYSIWEYFHAFYFMYVHNIITGKQWLA